MSGNHAGQLLLGRIPGKTKARAFLSTYVVNAADETSLIAAANEDARQYIYNGAVSFLSGMAGLQTQQAAWVITKMYYTAFYIGRAALARARRIIFHVEREGGNGFTQYEIEARAGERATVVNDFPSTHKLVADRFQKFGLPSFMRGLKIAEHDPLTWLMEQREYWQYRAGRFPDPDLPSILGRVDPEKLQRLFAEYDSDTRGIFLADPSHAVISVPFRLLVWALSIESLFSPGIIDKEDLKFLRRCCRIGRQKFTVIDEYFN